MAVKVRAELEAFQDLASIPSPSWLQWGQDEAELLSRGEPIPTIPSPCTSDLERAPGFGCLAGPIQSRGCLYAYLGTGSLIQTWLERSAQPWGEDKNGGDGGDWGYLALSRTGSLGEE